MSLDRALSLMFLAGFLVAGGLTLIAYCVREGSSRAVLAQPETTLHFPLARHDRRRASHSVAIQAPCASPNVTARPHV